MKRQILLMLAVLVSLAGMAQKDPMVIKTESGLVKGIDQEGSVGFLGIPYAKVERFMPPKPVNKWDTVMLCDHWGPQAMQNTWGRKLSEAEMSEQCCVLNVWTTTPLTSRQPSLKPVMFWLHGGGFDSGTSAWNPGMCLAKKDVVVVSVNHRLNILGFLGTDDEGGLTFCKAGDGDGLVIKLSFCDVLIINFDLYFLKIVEVIDLNLNCFTDLDGYFLI